jgi:hypothetical protein
MFYNDPLQEFSENLQTPNQKERFIIETVQPYLPFRDNNKCLEIWQEYFQSKYLSIKEFIKNELTFKEKKDN